MEREIPESDWKRWRRLSGELMEQFCSKTLDELASFATRSGSAHSRYLDLWKHIRKRDKILSEIFDNPRRSTAFFQIARAAEQGLLTDAQLEEFSEETQNVVELLRSL